VTPAKVNLKLIEYSDERSSGYEEFTGKTSSPVGECGTIIGALGVAVFLAFVIADAVG
jgi:hypothetical protein